MAQTKMTAQVVIRNGDSVTDTIARLLSSQHEKAVFTHTYTTDGNYVHLTLTTPLGLHDAECQDMAKRLESEGAYVSID